MADDRSAGAPPEDAEVVDPAPGSLERAKPSGPAEGSGIERAADGVIDLGIRVASPFVKLGYRGAREVGRRLGLNPAVERQVNKALDSDTAARTTQRVLETPAANQVWDKVLESDQAQKLVERVADAPEVRQAITRQGVGLLEDVRRTARRAARRLDGGLENVAHRVFRKPRRADRPIYAGGATRLIAILFDAALLSGILLLISTLLALLLNTVFSIEGSSDAVTIAFGAAAWWVASGIYLGAFWILAERTPGMTFMGLRISTESESRVAPRQDVRRLIGFGLALIPFGLGFLGILTKDKRQGWHDRYADTIVLYADTELDSELPGWRPPRAEEL